MRHLVSKKSLFITFGACVLFSGLLTGAILLYLKLYEERIYPNVSINDIAVGGLTTVEAQELLQSRFDEMMDAGLSVTVEGETAVIDLRPTGSTDPDLISDLVYADLATATENAYKIGRTGNWYIDAFSPIALLLANRATYANVTILEEPLVNELHETFADFELLPVPTTYTIEQSQDGYEIGATVGKTGMILDETGFLLELRRDVRDFSLSSKHVALIASEAPISENDALTQTNAVIRILENAPYTLTYTSPAERPYTFTLTESQLLTSLLPTKTKEGITLTLNGDAYDTLLESIREAIDEAPQDAKFEMANGRVVEFQGSINGVSLNEAESTKAIIDYALREERTIPLAYSVVAPEVPTEEVNDLGIREVLGVGISTFKGSPANRIVNIRHGANKLNGLLIAPGQTVSLVDELGPFTVADGYLPELVIKGDEIKPEIGGGLCQIGTTTFRAAMLSGLQIDERRNHSLVISYYGDPQNGNPGSDATIYDPAPDFKFTNDTEHHILLQTEMDMARSELVFTFWGTSDGREATYTPPQVLSWTGYGPTQYKETTDLAPGVERCQAPHAGATTSFDYIVKYADGTEHKKTYTSTYRSMPRICLVGVAPNASGSTDQPLAVEDVPTDLEVVE